MKDVKIITPKGIFGAWKNEPELVSLLRKIAVKYSKNPNEWADKYGTDFENGEFMMKPYCWCEQDGCPWCNPNKDDKYAPNFFHKKTGFEVRWYKYLGRDMEVNMKPPIKELKKLLKKTKE